MERFEREQTRVLELDDLEKMLEDRGMNPCVDQLIFVETRRSQKKERAIYPAYPAQIKVRENGKRALIFFVNQCIAAQYNTACVVLEEDEIGVKARFWTLPPTEALLEKMPLMSIAEAQ
jgi:hypothetical protein